MEKVIRNWKSEGFREKMLDVIEKKAKNTSLRKLRKITRRKRKQVRRGKVR